MRFEDLNLIKPILRAVAREGYEVPSPIQAEAIPLLLEGRDLLGCAQTGTGKTAAFAMPILQTLYGRRADSAKARHEMQALILTPTRELALQVAASFEAYGRYTGLTTAVVFGGVGQEPQVSALRDGVDILVATPGRLLDLIGQGLCDIGGISMFVLDEADRMLDMGFIHDVRKVIGLLPKERQTLMFSATMPAEIAKLAATVLNDPVTVAVTPVSSAVEVIEQSVYFVDKANKGRLLAYLLEDDAIASALVFSRTKHGADRIGKHLSREGIPVGVIHGDKTQGARVNALNGFKAGRTRVLVATDIAARGIDIIELSHVINYDLPNESETYVHRIGRTGRAGLGGTAISLCDFGEKEYLRDIEKLLGNGIPVVEGHPYPMQVFEVPEPQPRPPRPPRDRAAHTPEPAVRRAPQIPRAPEPAARRAPQIPRAPEPAARRAPQIPRAPEPAARRAPQIPRAPEPAARRAPQAAPAARVKRRYRSL
ncbi:MAG: DEAD/DEAH box helicase [Oscillospiraceae bacterium]|nr:DEAD/DEAH box helicase [Oscillospiraceae bacterium]